ncbi:MAG TPA: hypothetical protein VFY45_11305 [Baekduia sp.]|nr:hypothetical protein [Baekduia sp.]
MLHVRLRKGSANTARGALRFVCELIARVERAGATGIKLLRADSGFWNNKLTFPPNATHHRSTPNTHRQALLTDVGLTPLLDG